MFILLTFMFIDAFVCLYAPINELNEIAGTHLHRILSKFGDMHAMVLTLNNTNYIQNLNCFS